MNKEEQREEEIDKSPYAERDIMITCLDCGAHDFDVTGAGACKCC